MKNIFRNIYNKQGDNSKAMAEDNNENEITEEQTAEEPAQNTEKTAADAAEVQENDEMLKLQEKYDTLNNQYLRLAADFDNYRKRQAQEREALINFGAQECLKKILEVSDNFDRAMDMIEKIESADKLKETFHVLNKQLEDSLAKLGLERIKCEGEKFDPNLHEAVMQAPSDDEHPEDTIIKELQKGYIYAGKVLRPAMVSAAK